MGFDEQVEFYAWLVAHAFAVWCRSPSRHVRQGEERGRVWLLDLSFPSTRGIPSITSREYELRNLPCGLVLNFIIFRVKVCLKFTFYTDTSRSSKIQNK